MLFEFYGKECSHCTAMAPLVTRLEKEIGITVERLETWHNKDNEAEMEKYNKDNNGNTVCNGVPFFFNTKNNKFICGEVSYEELRAWAQD